MKMNRNGEMTLEYMLKLIIGIVCFLGLVFLGVMLYGLVKDNTKVEQAKMSLNQMNDIMKGLKDGERTEYILLSPTGSVLKGFDDGAGKRDCISGKPCLCFCSDLECADKIFYCLSIDRRFKVDSAGNIIQNLPVKLVFSLQGTSYYNVEVMEQ